MAACSSTAGRSPPIVASGRDLLIDTAPLFIKGIAWSPFVTGRSPNLGHAPDFTGQVAQDASLMQAADINVVRTYAPITSPSVLDTLWAHGIAVINTVYYDSGYGDTATTAVANVCAVKSHPAILMWAVTNEPNYYYNGASYMEDIGPVIRAIQAADATRPVTVVWGEVPTPAVIASVSDVDVWGVNIYRGTTFTDLWTAWPALSTKPFFVSEYGVDSYDTAAAAADESTQAAELRNLANEVAAKATATGAGPCLGGVLFEFADEWWKYAPGSPSVHDTTPSWTAAGGYSDLSMQEEFFGLVSVSRQPKASHAAYAALAKPSAAAVFGPSSGSAPPTAPTLDPLPAAGTASGGGGGGGVGVGVGVGVGGCAVLLVTALLVYRQRKRNKVTPTSSPGWYARLLRSSSRASTTTV